MIARTLTVSTALTDECVSAAAFTGGGLLAAGFGAGFAVAFPPGGAAALPPGAAAAFFGDATEAYITMSK